MSVNKILALIGNILQSLVGGIGALVFFVSGIMVLTDSSYGYGADAKIGGTFAFLLALITLAIIAVSWIGFAKLDKANDKGWKIYFLVIGIVTTLFTVGINIVTGVLFILTFALKTSSDSVQGQAQPEAVTTWESESQTPISAEVIPSESVASTSISSSETESASEFGWTQVSSESGQD